MNGVQKEGHSKEQWIEKQIDKYAPFLPNLRKHNRDYSGGNYLLRVLKVGNENPQDLHKAAPLISDNERAQLIIKTAFDNDFRPRLLM